MSPTMMVLIAAAIAILAFAARAFHDNHPQVRAPAQAKARTAAPPRTPGPIAAPAHKPHAPPKAVSTLPPELFLLEWEPVAGAEPEIIQAAGQAGQVHQAGQDALRAKLRDRYIEVRFPGVARSSADLRDAERVIRGVRLYFEEQKFDRADELLELAIQAGSAKLPRLARLELAFLRRDAARFTEFARDFRATHPDSPEWLEIARLGRALAPDQTTLFGSHQGARAQDRYGPWPDMPNWLHASWDLTPEVLAADLHREMADSSAPAVPAFHRNAA